MEKDPLNIANGLIILMIFSLSDLPATYRQEQLQQVTQNQLDNFFCAF
jgi:hypothetical protein